MYTPNIDALARQSLVLRKNYCQQAICGPTRASLLTSRRPDRTRVWDLSSYWRTVGGNYTTIPQLFRQHGYETVGMVCTHHLLMTALNFHSNRQSESISPELRVAGQNISRKQRDASYT